MCVRKSLLLLAAALTAPIVVAQTSPAAPASIAFEVATIKPSKAAGWRLQPTLDGYTAMGVTLRMLMQEAYGVYNNQLVSGGPAWIDSDKFDLEAKLDSATAASSSKLTFRQRADMLQPLLAERFHLRVHREAKPFPVYNLVVARGGPKVQPTEQEASKDEGIGVTCHVLKNRSGYTQRQDCAIASLNDLLRYATGRPVLDKTGLAGHYDFELRWAPEEASSLDANDSSGPSIFTAVQEQLGLKLEPGTGI